MTREQPLTVAHLGPPGTFGEEAALAYAPGATLLPQPSHAAVAAAVDEGLADEGIVAIENSINGSVAETLDILIHDTALQIQSELVVPVRHNLVLPPGAALEDVEVIYSHPQALGQCRPYLERAHPNAQLEAALSTSEAVRMALARPGAAAISTRRAAELYGGVVAVEDIHEHKNNMTRFVVLGRGRTHSTGRDRTSIAFTFADDRPGRLVGVLQVLADRGINCSKMESRPTRGEFGEYVFLIDFHGHVEDAVVIDALADIRALCSELKVFGSYPRWQ